MSIHADIARYIELFANALEILSIQKPDEKLSVSDLTQLYDDCQDIIRYLYQSGALLLDTPTDLNLSHVKKAICLAQQSYRSLSNILCNL